MHTRKAGLIGAIAGMASMGVAQAALHPSAPAGLQPASSYAELLRPIPNATEVLKASNAELLAQAHARVIEVQYNGGDSHHHHSNYAPPVEHHHHHAHYAPPVEHHHHHQGTTIVIPGVGGIHTGG